MASIADIERLLEQVFERSTTRLFRTRVQAVQLEHRVERAMERARDGRGSRTEVPSRYRVRIHPADLTGLAPDAASAQVLAARLADAALAFARAHAYHLARRPSVSVVADPSLQRGRVEVDVDARPVGEGRSLQASPPGVVVGVRDAAVASVPATSAPSEPALPVGPLSLDRSPRPDAVSSADSAPASDVPATLRADGGPTPGGPAALDALPVAEPVDLGIRGGGSQTHVFRRPSPESARAVLRVLGQDGREASIEVDGRPLTLGRARDNVLVLDDSRVSRHHGRLLARHGALVYADLDSTNGSRVNGVRVDEIALGVGDRILLGDTVLVVESLPS